MSETDTAIKELERQRQKTKRRLQNGQVKPITTEKKREIITRYKNKYPVKAEAHRIFQIAVKDGKIIHQPCEVCGRQDSEGHHEDYSKPLEVIWLCSTHHAERHVQIRREQLWKRMQESA
jgi:hypothetical protein